jgi:cytochrome c2
MKNITVYLLVFLFLAVSVKAVYSGQEAVDGKALFEKKCRLCHSIERPKSKQKTADGWKSTVTRMKNVNGAPITDEEAKIIIDYLAENYGA